MNFHASKPNRSAPASFPYRRVWVIGSSGTGKTTLARELARRIGAEHIEIDAIFHLPNWEDMPAEEFIEAVHARTQTERWVADGNYMNYLRRIERAELIIWLDYPFRIVIRRILVRTISRLISRKPLWNGNRESLRMALSREGMVYWVFSTYWKRRRQFPRMLQMRGFREIAQIRFRHPREAREWLQRWQHASIVAE